MPGMMDTVLNLGLNDRPSRASSRSPATSASPGTPTAASSRCSATSSWASKKTSSSTYSSRKKDARRIKLDIDLNVEDLKEIVAGFKKKVKSITGTGFPAGRA